MDGQADQQTDGQTTQYFIYIDEAEDNHILFYSTRH